MTDRFVQVPSSEIRLGMFIAELDRPWLETPFLVQGFLLDEDKQITLIKDLCKFVVVDTGRSERGRATPAQRTSLGKSLQQTFEHTRLQTYRDDQPFEKEISCAKKIYRDYEATIAKIYGDYGAARKIDYQAAEQAVSNIVDSVIRNPDACILLQKLKRKGDYLYNRAMGTSIWAAALARQIGLPAEDIKIIALGGLLCDIGKVGISERILDKAGSLDEQEFEVIKQHVALDEQFRDQHQEISGQVLSIIKSHHERHDGSGYPEGLKGDEIPIFARIVGLADSYDAMTNHRTHAKAMPPYLASKELYELRDIKFQAEIVEEFIQATGIYPVGTMVELNTGEIGVVIAENRARRLRPKLLMLMDAEKNQLEDINYRNLADFSPEEFAISASLEAGAYGLDPDELFQ